MMTVGKSICVCLALVAGLAARDATAAGLLPPIQLAANGKPIDTQRSGHAAPFVGDIDGDGLDDLLVGEYYKGRLRIFPNAGTKSQFKFATHQWFHAGGGLGGVPNG